MEPTLIAPVKPTFAATATTLIEAYENGTLRKGDSCSCAAGNLVAKALGRKIIPRDKSVHALRWDNGIPRWTNVFYTPGSWPVQIWDRGEYYGSARSQIEATGYELEQLARIEHVFEATAQGKSPYPAHASLLAVLTEIGCLHDIPLEEVEAVKDRFLVKNPYSLEDTVHVSQGTLRHLVDLVYGYAMEDESVPSTRVADRLISTALEETTASDAR